MKNEYVFSMKKTIFTHNYYDIANVFLMVYVTEKPCRKKSVSFYLCEVF